jgi:protein required for attachment to host cells
MQSMDDIWIVVANRTDARILTHRKGHPVIELETLVCPEARQPDRSMLTDAPGRSHDRKGPARHAMEPPTNVNDQISRQFARRIAERLERGRNEHAWQNLVLVAGPKFLGLLREELGSHCMQLVLAETHKNIVKHSVEEIVAALPYEVQNRVKNP